MNILKTSVFIFCEPHSGKLWKAPQYITSDQITSPPTINDSSPTTFHHPQNNSASNHRLLSQAANHHPYDFPLLYHLLMLQNYCSKSYNDFFNMESRGVCGNFEPNQNIANFTMTPQVLLRILFEFVTVSTFSCSIYASLLF